MIIGNTGRGRRKGLFAKMQAGTVETRWTRQPVEVEGKIRTKYVLGCIDGDKFIPYGMFDKLTDLRVKAETSRLPKPKELKDKIAA